MAVLFFLVLFPIGVALLTALAPNHQVRNWIVKVSAGIISAATCILTFLFLKFDLNYYEINFEAINKVMLCLELLIGAYVVYLGIKDKKYLISLLMAAQAIVLCWIEFKLIGSVEIEYNMFIDKFSLIMAILVGIIGSFICLYSVGYMHDYHKNHKEIKDQRRKFFFILFIFLSAMFGMIFSNNLMWLYFFWEITTLCSFLLIGYTGTEESRNNAYRALMFNVLGGLAFAVALALLASKAGILELNKLISGEKVSVLIPAVLICFAGLTKSAQMPFSSWLLGAMVAPTPTSALLHSSTMVKAGVYVIIRLAPILNDTAAGFLVALVGGFTFLIASLIAIAQTDAKKVLAYSTIANLGLIVTCGGIGTYESVWAAVLLIIFHAVAKSLLFLCVGTVEHELGSRNIEVMHGLIKKMPILAIMLIVGIAGMFLAPFGMLISKWAALKAIVDTNPLLVIFIAFGSAATLFFWTKWMGKIIAIPQKEEQMEIIVKKTEILPMAVLSVATIMVCLMFPFISSKLVNPYVVEVFNHGASMDTGNVIIMLIMMGLILLLPIRLLVSRKELKEVSIYLGGANADEPKRFYGSMGTVQKLYIENYYMDRYFGEGRLFKIGLAICSAATLLMLVMAFIY
ncbi:NADH-quinone oxidoreductase subunit L [Acetivibrio clariflavus]|uniref:NADH:ubiquinone oxidoreductase subunit 5 (Chain L)/multisubunit Na+/H+ antiporter, MnhA subunit n=1 Tax=Acetivibrio clariflavus (strain DSM 19732 / NBRC 101661 / EBR45) TaxID=720554 RepID=G8LX02_ACECE|nr:proton-conducting transporter membrane subunit [Acetivibrio clariflavus]AEV67654.1 NADH:ubiquinone oxidoreductase subunit 5 (chain L)/multisubunit Na+/H+ antiporter, MnhA subunit [Acetivibrio clariflavus DSM 19732]